MLIVKTTSDTDINLTQLQSSFSESMYIDMHFQGKSNSIPLYSDNFANCLAVIVHDAENKRGYLMHIFPGFSGGVNTTLLFHFIDKQIENVLLEFSDSKNINLLLWKGISYTPAILPDLSMSYAEYAAIKFKDKVTTIIDIMDTKKSTKESKIFYNPQKNEAVIIDYKHSELFNKNSLNHRSEMKLDFWSENTELAENTEKTILSILNENDEFGEWVGADQQIIDTPFFTANTDLFLFKNYSNTSYQVNVSPMTNDKPNVALAVVSSTI